MAFQLLSPATFVCVLIATVLTGSYLNSMLRTVGNRPTRATPWQFRLADIYVLLFQLALSGWLTFEVDDEFGPAWSVGGFAVLWSLQAYWWYLGIRFLSANQITDPLRRLVILGILFPILSFFPLVNCIMSMLFVVSAVLAFLALVIYVKCMKIAVAWAIRTKPTANPGRRAGWIVVLALFIFTTPVAMSPMWSGLTFGPEYYKFQVRRYRKELRLTADVPAIQAWMKTANIAALPEHSLVRRDLPPSVQRYLDGWPFVTEDGTLVLVNGGGFCHWGVEIAPKGSPKPKWSSSHYSLPLADGAWVWIDDH